MEVLPCREKQREGKKVMETLGEKDRYHKKYKVRLSPKIEKKKGKRT